MVPILTLPFTIQLVHSLNLIRYTTEIGTKCNKICCLLFSHDWITQLLTGTIILKGSVQSGKFHSPQLMIIYSIEKCQSSMRKAPYSFQTTTQNAEIYSIRSYMTKKALNPHI